MARILGKTVADLGRQMDMQELIEWRVFLDLEAEGAIQQDLRATVEQQLTQARIG